MSLCVTEEEPRRRETEGGIFSGGLAYSTLVQAGK